MAKWANRETARHFAYQGGFYCMENITLNNGVKMPMEGFGVFQIPEDTCEQVVRDANR